MNYNDLFYQEGNFRKTIEIIEPIIVGLESAKEIDKSVAVADEMMYMDKNGYYEKKK